MDSPEFEVYVKPGCPWCIDVIAYLKKAGYSYQLIDVIADRTAFQKMIDLSGQSSAPTMTVGDLLLADFGVEELVPFLKEHGLFREA
ncbi:MAG: glutaredoxin family protein [Verrucomicrobiota bacterium]